MNVGEDVWPFRGASVQEFTRRAETYRPSQVATEYFRGCNAELSRLGDGGAVNLFDWIRRTLVRADGADLRGQFGHIVLTGGSCEWPFMDELASKAFGVDLKNIIRSPNPEITIGSGLAIYNILIGRNELTRQTLRQEKAPRVSAFDRDISAKIQSFASDLAGSILDRLMPKVERIMLEWRSGGGSLNDVERKVNAAIHSSEDEIRGVIDARFQEASATLTRTLRDHLNRWLSEHGIQREVGQFLPRAFDGRAPRPGGDDPSRTMAMEVANRLHLTVVALVAAITAMVLGHVAAAWFLVDFVGGSLILLGAILAPFIPGVRDRMEDVVKSHSWGSFPGSADLWAMQKVISEDLIKRKLGEGRSKANPRIAAEIEQAMGGFHRLAVSTFDEAVEGVIKDLGFLDEVQTRGVN